MEPTKLKILWMITERGDRSYWTRVGVGMVNRDGSITMSLDAIPLGNSKLQLRDYTPRDAEQASSPDDGGAPPAGPAPQGSPPPAGQAQAPAQAQPQAAGAQPPPAASSRHQTVRAKGEPRPESRP